MSIKYEEFLDLPYAQKYERYIKALCPFHEDKTPSLLVFADGWWRCLGCGRVGKWDSLHRKMKGLNIVIRPELDTHWHGPNFIRMRAEDVAYVAHDDLLQFPSYGWYLEMRGVSGRVEVCQLGYWKGWYTVPSFSEDGQFVGVWMRAAPHVQAATGLRNYYRGRPNLYVPDWHRIRTAKVIFVTYGVFDALSISELGFAVVTPGGHQNMRVEWLEQFRKPLVFLPDQDEEDKAVKQIGQLGWRGHLETLMYKNHWKDPNDLLINDPEYLRTALINAETRYGQQSPRVAAVLQGLHV